ncbi:unnamed protein product [Rotaria sp. Silwood2]|nr:unnamed protein product [Rotaria sp. Silwood2]CAF2855676.1 unnamed protein product [Rotaria sp. Silwood2]CAF3109433.1 unnamed protein product [Rotaria sp. Silwood2]CAF3498682.1 unnamed protein product [Rotaria sp. Silwood2]CAF3995810.1 unnamed protein product [Rotaria sp. Silwood2]
MNFITGTCLCGQIIVTITKEALAATDKTYICRCKNCRQSGGSLASIGIIVPESAFNITGQPKIYLDSNTDSGTSIQRAFCGNCGSQIYTASPTMPGVKILKLGLFDEIPKPSMELYCRERPSWDKPIEGTKQFYTMPTKDS